MTRFRSQHDSSNSPFEVSPVLGMLIVAILTFPLACFAQVPTYTVKDLDTLGGSLSAARAINNAGQVVGMADDTAGNRRAFLWTSAAGIQDLHTSTSPSFALGINGPGDAVGTQGDPCRLTGQGFLSNSTNRNTVQLLPLGQAAAINDSGWIAGNAGNPQYAVYSTPPYTGSTPIAAFSSAGNGINNNNEIVGFMGSQAFRWTESGGLQSLGPTSNDGWAINNLGQIVGQKTGQRAMLWTSSAGAVDIGSLPNGSYSIAWAINNFGQVVGSSTTSSTDTRAETFFPVCGSGVISPTLNAGSNHAFLWTPATPGATTGTMTDLNTRISDSSWVLQEAMGINDKGQIVGYGLHNGQTRAFLLTPGPPPTEVFTTITSAGIIGTLVYKGTPNTTADYAIIVTDSNNNTFNAGGGTNAFDNTGNFSLTGLNLENYTFPPTWSDGTYTIYIFTAFNDFAKCEISLICVNDVYFTTFYRTAGVWSTVSSLQPAITVSPQQIPFPPTTLNTTSSPVTVTISNSGTATLTISSVTAQCLNCPAGTANPFVIGSVPISIPAGGQDTFAVKFSPVGPGPFMGNVTIVSNAPTSPTVILLQGTEVFPPPLITSVSPNSGVQGQTIDNFTVNGSNFQGGAILSFSLVGVTVNSYTSRMPTQIVARITIASNATAGVGAALVTNPDAQQSSLVGGFQVITLVTVLGEQKSGGSLVEPVSTGTGNYYTLHSDLTVPGKGLLFGFIRFYNSLDSYSGPLGSLEQQKL